MAIPGCLGCGQYQWEVIDSRPEKYDKRIYRRRRCLSCGQRITTFEITSEYYYELKRMAKVGREYEQKYGLNQ